MAGGWAPKDLWNKWEIQILVLLSFGAHVVLLLAGMCRREYPAAGLLRPFVWMAYQLAEPTAMYALGQLSFGSNVRALPAFWAPFLLLHLGGPDSITAYSFEDNKLWRRQLLDVLTKTIAAAYVLYKHVPGGLKVPAALMFVTGTLKYGERNWAFQRSNLDNIRRSLMSRPRDRHYVSREYDLSLSQELGGGHVVHEDEELLLRRAHSVFHICKRATVDASNDEDPDYNDKNLLDYRWKTLWRLVEMELSLLYDILYTKAPVIHTLPGYSIRFVAVVATVASSLLFWYGAKDGDNRLDIIVTFVLLVGALILELKSLLGALTSSWTLPFLYATRWRWLHHAVLCSGRWHRFRRATVYLRRPLGIPIFRRRWSGTMDQYNMLRFCTRDVTSTCGWWDWLMQKPWLEEWWDTRQNAWTFEVTDGFKEKLYTYVKETFKKDNVNAVGVVRERWGKKALQKHNLYEPLKYFLYPEFMETIMVWHVGTDLFLSQRRVDGHDQEVRYIKAISNYMTFLLVKQPDMLPGLPLSGLYEVICKDMERLWLDKGPAATTGTPYSGHGRIMLQRRSYELARILFENKSQVEYSHKNPRLKFAIYLAEKLASLNDPVEAVLDVWLDFLVYAANRCRRESHAQKLSTGAELTTVIWLMVEILNNYIRTNRIDPAATK